jgi:hypothetical protein
LTDGMAVALFFIATLVAPAVAAYALRRTPAWWFSGAALAGFGVYLFGTLDHTDHHGEGGMGGWTAIGNFIQVAYGMFLLVYALILVIAARVGRRAVRRPPRIPPAKVV